MDTDEPRPETNLLEPRMDANKDPLRFYAQLVCHSSELQLVPGGRIYSWFIFSGVAAGLRALQLRMVTNERAFRVHSRLFAVQ
jgi:hypothetical protein